MLPVGIHFIIEILEFSLFSIFLRCQFDISSFFQCCDPGDEPISTSWGFVATKTHSEEDNDEDCGENIRSICYMDLPGGREKHTFQGGVQKSELFRRRDVKFVHVRKCEAVQPLGFYVVRLLANLAVKYSRLSASTFIKTDNVMFGTCKQLLRFEYR